MTGSQSQQTMLAVAELAQVSIATVSRVINNPSRVAPKTRERVLAAIRQMNYSYNALAGSLSRQRTMTLGLIVPTITNPIFAESTRGVQEVATRQGYTLLIGNSDYRADEEERLVRVFRQQRVDGMIVTSSHARSPALLEAHMAGAPIVLTYSYRPGSPLPSVGVDNQASAAAAAGYLIRLGHTRIAMLAGVFSGSDRSYARYMGYKAALAAHDIPYDPQLLIETPYTVEAGMAGLNRLLDLDSPPTAIFCANDILAFGALRAALDRGLTLPDDLSLLGFDDSPMAALTNPRLSTVFQPAQAMGEQACTLLLRLIQGEPIPETVVVLPTELRVRETTAPPRT
jgi:DNA-binding LacI/PurR family transcriptional regulator